MKASQKVFFPWERRRGLLGAIGRTRVRFIPRDSDFYRLARALEYQQNDRPGD